MVGHKNATSLLFVLDDFLTLLCWHFKCLNRRHDKLVKSPGGGGTPIWERHRCSLYLWGIKSGFWYLFEYLPSKGPQRELLQYLLEHWGQKIWEEIMCYIRIGTNLFGVLFKISNNHPILFVWESPTPLPGSRVSCWQVK